MPTLPTRYLDLPDLRVAYREAGSGPTLLLLHGNSESKKIFAIYQQEFFTDFTTLALDSRGHGQSRSKDTEYTIAQYCQDVIHFCRAKGISKTHLVGYSDGGNIALFLAQRAPELFERVVAISPNTLVSATEEDTLRLFTRMQKIFKFLRKFGLPTQKYIMRFNLMLTDIGISDEELATIRTGMKILYAEHEMIKESHIQDIARLIPNTDLEKVMGCTHMNILNQPRTVEAIREYLLK